MDTTHADPMVSSALTGIERFYPGQLFRKARQRNVALVNTDQNGVLSIHKTDLSASVKRELAQMLLEGPPKWCAPLQRVLRDIEVHSKQ